MARAVLGGALAVWAIFASPARASGAMPLCHGTIGQMGVQPADVIGSPLAREMTRVAGPLLRCEMSDGDAGRTIVLGWPGGARLTVSSNETLESAAQEAAWPAGAWAVSPAQALVLVHDIERAATGPDGCGLDDRAFPRGAWPVAADTILVGKTCNCRAHIRSSAGQALELGFSTAC